MRVSFAASLLLLTPAVHGAQKIPRFNPHDSLWSVHTQRTLAKPDHEPSGDELAPTLGLEPLAVEDCVKQYRHRATGMRFVFVPGSTFALGSDHAAIYGRQDILNAARAGRETDQYFNAEQPQTDVYVSPFFIGLFEVKLGEYKKFLNAVADTEATPYVYPYGEPQEHAPLFWDREMEAWQDDEYPIVGVSWLSAYAFCKWMGGRLPTEAEWEKAARGTDGRIFPWGNVFDPMRANCHESMNAGLVPVGLYSGGRSPYGCYDMAGNALEYTLDCFEQTVYRRFPQTNPCLLERAPVTDLRVARGGTWVRLGGGMHRARVSSRGSLGMVVASSPAFPAADYMHFGFRVVLSPLKDLYPPGWKEQELADPRHPRKRQNKSDEQENPR